ncbi:hypothetical protein ANCCAN_17162 [Ancylostoma caninum]|uniref:Uncharacterized protein n=1 Tax=Ancylostoma caninum TaxID=29170 RepID=A0A368G1Q9_ANCCA|nr:hypothetical protein ANCCAN_17162 [Ancylostoma caninum]
MPVENGECQRAHSSDVLAVGSRASDRAAVTASPRRAVFRNASTNSSTSSRNSRGVRAEEIHAVSGGKSHRSLMKVMRAVQFVVASKQRSSNPLLKVSSTTVM